MPHRRRGPFFGFDSSTESATRSSAEDDTETVNADRRAISSTKKRRVVGLTRSTGGAAVSGDGVAVPECLGFSLRGHAAVPEVVLSRELTDGLRVPVRKHDHIEVIARTETE